MATLVVYSGNNLVQSGQSAWQRPLGELRGKRQFHPINQPLVELRIPFDPVVVGGPSIFEATTTAATELYGC